MSEGGATLVVVRAGVVVVALAIWYGTQRLIAQRAATAAESGGREHPADPVLAWTAGWNAWLRVHARATDRLLVASSAMIDALGLWLIGTSVLGPTFRPFLALLMVFALRQVCQGLVTLPLPRGTIWRDPGVPSLLVTYGTSNDLFFSGHTAICALAALEAGRVAPLWVALAVGVVAAMQATFVLALRAHYTVDVLAGALAAWGCDALAVRFAPAVDAWLASVA